MVRQTQLLGRPGDVPLVPLESREQDPPLRFGLERLEGLPAPRLPTPASPRISAGTCSGPMVSPSVAMIIRSTTFRSSRTLFRAQS